MDVVVWGDPLRVELFMLFVEVILAILFTCSICGFCEGNIAKIISSDFTVDFGVYRGRDCVQ